jgi:hypothetical protein
MARFLDRLNKEIINVLELQHYIEVKTKHGSYGY